MILRTIRAVGIAVVVGVSSAAFVAGPALAAPVTPIIDSKVDCRDFSDQVFSLTRDKNDVLARVAIAQAEVNRLQPIVTYAEYWYGGMDFNVRSQAAYVQHLIDIGAPAADIAFHQSELVRLTAYRDSYTPAIEDLRKQLGGARNVLAVVQQELTMVDSEINALRRLMKSVGCSFDRPPRSA
jgi:hypothetical protein